MNEIVSATLDSDMTEFRELFAEYSGSLAIDLNLQHIDEEIASLPGCYAPPQGTLFLARVTGAAAGCIGVRPFSAGTGEVKRLFVRPGFRGRGLARSLISSAIAFAKDTGYQALVLDTLSTMDPAISLYESFGFRRTE